MKEKGETHTQRDRGRQRDKDRVRDTPRERPNLYIRNKEAFSMGPFLQSYVKVYCLANQKITVFENKVYKVVTKVI